MSRIARNSVNGRLNRNTFCSCAEVALVQCKRAVESKIKISSFTALPFLNAYQKNNNNTIEDSGGSRKYPDIYKLINRLTQNAMPIQASYMNYR